MNIETREQAHAQATDEAHTYFGAHETRDASWAKAREAWIVKRETKLYATGGEDVKK